MKQPIYLTLLTAAFSLSRPGCAQHVVGPENPTAYSRQLWKSKYTRPASIPFPPENQFTEARALLGRTLFFDPRLSGSNSISCATCHNPGFAWGDALPKAIGYGTRQLRRRTPTLLNIAWAELLFWDGRADSLEQQALGPIESHEEMNRPLDELPAVLGCIPEYRELFERAYPKERVTPTLVARALATFERTLVSGPAPFDEWISGRESAISESARRGFDLFNSKAACQKCHTEWNFTDNGFHDIGLSDDDKGRGKELPLESMQHAFKTPTLRDVDRRAPYMHNGSAATLEEVIDIYDRGGPEKYDVKKHDGEKHDGEKRDVEKREVEKRPSLSPEIVPLHLTAQEKIDLLAFLHTLTSHSKPVELPALPR